MVPIDFDKPRQLRFDLAAVRDLEAAMGGRPLAAIIGDLSQVGVNAMVMALWAGLQHEDPSITQKWVEKRLQAYIERRKSLRAIARALNDALDETGLFRSEDEGNEQPEAAASA